MYTVCIRILRTPALSIFSVPIVPILLPVLCSALLVIDGFPAAEERDLVLDGVDGVADNGEDDEEDYDYYCDNEVAFHHCRGCEGRVGW